MVYAKQPDGIFAPKFILNGMPKSGLHLIVQMVQPIAPKMPPSAQHPHQWIGTFAYHSFSGNWKTRWEPFYWKICRLAMGHYYKAHVGWKEHISDFIEKSGCAMVFIYRDLRDVAVSQAHHVLNPDDTKFQHADKGFFMRLNETKGFDAVLAAVIEGIGPYPGVMERWEYFAPWLAEDWVLSVRFEDARADPKGVAEWIVQYGYGRTASVFRNKIEFGPEIHEKVRLMCKNSRRTGESPTFRKGEVGGWREAFTDEHKDLFKQTDENDWLIRLGYEESGDW